MKSIRPCVACSSRNPSHHIVRYPFSMANKIHHASSVTLPRGPTSKPSCISTS
ncbi:unnamed protein product [Chondrus crispus]|uniref:Uncharacterized protein n=1 Tax=Chondrus crispus TaxID=2769 RepID=R7QM11_CHOCR|nr:unnamed protein product [Chondrus crispus]CDF38823.1 unnamed protein product [Chondrus crispus]|eukprot:XP_005718728.1 unnamed protein product [Chondrus crispus]